MRISASVTTKVINRLPGSLRQLTVDNIPISGLLVTSTGAVHWVQNVHCTKCLYAYFRGRKIMYLKYQSEYMR